MLPQHTQSKGTWEEFNAESFIANIFWYIPDIWLFKIRHLIKPALYFDEAVCGKETDSLMIETLGKAQGQTPC